MYSPQLVSVIFAVVPLYRIEELLEQLGTRLGSSLAEMRCRFGLELVNDDGFDRGWQAVGKLAATLQWTRGISRMRNFGQHDALRCGVRTGRSSIKVDMDDDLQRPPKDPLKLLGSILDAVGALPGLGHFARLCYLSSASTKVALGRVIGAWITRMVSAWDAGPARMKKAYASCQSLLVMIGALLAAAGRSSVPLLPALHLPHAFEPTN